MIPSSHVFSSVVRELLDEPFTASRPFSAIAGDLELVLELGPLIWACWTEAPYINSCDPV
ncbi:unannotated protein [freshwater metagenome]|uniref:Unannotated protein n=1 Tax=freshwater metagenome TaxID=449393 RepID=A0A6J6JPS1_9ZZZZ